MKFNYQSEGATPLPWRQMLILSGVRLAEPINYQLIYPFINEMVVEVAAVPIEDVGFYSGLIEGLFALTQCLVVYQWGSLSDRLGRRPVILMGLIGVGVSGMSFGLSKTFIAMLISRALNGALCGNVAVIKASLGEITDETNQSIAFPLYGLTWIVGQVLGSMMGGYLSHPVERIPSIFGGNAFLQEYPFFLPCAVASGVTAAGWIFAFLFFEETLERPPPPSGSYITSALQDAESYELLATSTSSTFSPSSTTKSFCPTHKRQSSSISTLDGRTWGFMDLLRLPLVRRVALSSFLMSLIAGSFSAVLLLVCYSPIMEGGLALSASQTGTTLALNGIWSIIVQLVFLPPLQVRFGPAPLFHWFNVGWISPWFLLPFLNYLARATASTAASEGGMSSLVWLSIAGMLALTTVFNTCGSIVMILINSASPSKSALGALNGITQTGGSLARALGPAMVSSLFAFSQSGGGRREGGGGGGKVMGGNLWWVVMALFAVLSGIVGFSVKSGTSSDARGGRDQERLESIDEVDEPGGCEGGGDERKTLVIASQEEGARIDAEGFKER